MKSLNYKKPFLSYTRLPITHTESLFIKSEILPLPDLIYFFKLQFMQQYINCLLPKTFNNTWLTLEAKRHNLNIEHTLRNSDNLYLPIARLTTISKHPFFLFPRLWDNFHEETIKIMREESQFNTHLKNSSSTNSTLISHAPN